MSAPAVYGVRETLAELKSLDGALYRQALADMRSAAEPLAGDVRSRIPTAAPLSGMARGGRMGWTPAGTRVAVRTGGRRPRTAEYWPLVRIQLAGASASLFDMAGRASSSQFSNALSARFGRPSRAAWPGVEANLAAIRAATAAACERVMREATARLAA